MANVGSLQNSLLALDGSAPSVKKAASAMMKHYDRTAAVAVTEWRNALSTSTNSQHLMSLLYVANEVLQISKRNRGNKFLEAFSGILGQALQHICRQDPALTDKVRRTVKIWGDRRVFSVRFVQELLNGLESFRQSAAAASKTTAAPPTAQKSIAAVSSRTSNLPSSRPTFQSDEDGSTFSPVQGNPSEVSNSSPSVDAKATDANDDDDNDGDIMEILEATENANQDEEEDDDDDDMDIFASDTQLKVDIDLEQVAAATEDSNNNMASPSNSSSMKKRRSSATSTGSGTTSKRRRRNSGLAKNMLSTNSLLELASTVTKLQDDFEESQRTLQRIDRNLAKKSTEDLEQIVGDELLTEFRQIVQYQEQIVSEKKRLHIIAQQRKNLEQEAMTYLPWLEKALQRDQEDIDFCNRLEKSLEAFSPIHTELRKARDIRRAEERRRIEIEAEKERIRKEKEESERFRQESLRRQTEQSDGMVWNPSTQEYQELNTEESWRD